MRAWLFAIAVIDAMASLRCTTPDYPPCEHGLEGAGGAPVVHVTVGQAVGPTAASGGDWAATEAPHGYMTASNGVCACSAEDAQRYGCQDEPPSSRNELCAPDEVPEADACDGPLGYFPDPDGGAVVPPDSAKPFLGQEWQCTAKTTCTKGAESFWVYASDWNTTEQEAIGSAWFRADWACVTGYGGKVDRSKPEYTSFTCKKGKAPTAKKIFVFMQRIVLHRPIRRRRPLHTLPRVRCRHIQRVVNSGRRDAVFCARA